MHRSPKRILLVEDDAAVARAVAEFLKPFPLIEIRRAATFADARAELLDPKLRLVVLDLALPDSSHLDAIAEIRERRPEVGLVVLTGNDEVEVAVATLRLGADDFLLKRRLSAESLEKSLRYVLDRKEIQNERDVFFSVSLDLICVAGPDGYFKQVNPAFESVLGYTPAEMYARPILEFLHPDDFEVTARALADSAYQAIVSFENRYRCRDGRYKYLSWKSVPLGDKIYATARDITEQREMSAKLFQADRMIVVGTLASGVAHEINNPLAYLILNLNAMLESVGAGPERPETELRAGIRSSIEAAERIREIVSGLKGYSRDADADDRPVDLTVPLETAMRMAKHQVKPRAQLVFDRASVPPVLGNSGRLAQVFLNLLINAAQAIPEGNAAHETVSISLRPTPGGEVGVEIRDSGTGMTEDVRSRLFDPFFTTKPVGVGTGLGLYICQGIVQSYGGRIEVESEPGKGSVFRVIFPVASSVAEKHGNSMAPVTGARRRLRLLVVDDEVPLAEAIVSAIGKFHDVEMVSTGAAALERIRSASPYDLYLCELMMPGIGGGEIYRALESDGKGLEKRLLFMTGGAFTPETVKFLDAVENPKIEKPFDLTRLLDVIDRRAKSLGPA